MNVRERNWSDNWSWSVCWGVLAICNPRKFLKLFPVHEIELCWAGKAFDNPCPMTIKIRLNMQLAAAAKILTLTTQVIRMLPIFVPGRGPTSVHIVSISFLFVNYGIFDHEAFTILKWIVFCSLWKKLILSVFPSVYIFMFCKRFPRNNKRVSINISESEVHDWKSSLPRRRGRSKWDKMSLTNEKFTKIVDSFFSYKSK